MTMKKSLFALFILMICFVSPAFALSDVNVTLAEWEYYYFQYQLKGYPTYNALLERYDFYDLERNYCGSLCYNSLLEKWEYFGL